MISCPSQVHLFSDISNPDLSENLTSKLGLSEASLKSLSAKKPALYTKLNKHRKFFGMSKPMGKLLSKLEIGKKGSVDLEPINR